MIPYYTGASETGAPQREPADSIGGFRSGSFFHSMEWDMPDPMPGVVLRDVSGGNGQGIGSLTAATADSVTWTEPGAASAGAAVDLPEAEEVIVRGLEPGAFIRVARLSDAPLQGAKSVTCVDVLDNLFPEVETADAVAGLVTERALMLLNSLGAATDFSASVISGDIAIAIEEPTAGELLGAGLSYGSTDTLATVDDGAEVGLWIRRTITADAAASPNETWEIEYTFTVDAVEYTESLRGRYRVQRTDLAQTGIWIGLGALPDFEAAPDETWTGATHTTSLGLTLPATVWAAFRTQNAWGMWGIPTTPVRYDIDAGGDVAQVAPIAPTDVSVGQTSGNLPTVGAIYDADADGDSRAALWVIWMETDGTDPDGSGTPAGYVRMLNNAAVDDLAWISDGAALMDGTPVSVLVRTRRLDSAGGTAFSPDVIQLDDTNTGPLKVDADISDWPASGYATTTTRFGRLLEVFHYSSIAVSLGQTTVTVDERGLWGTTATATIATHIITPVVPVDSENTTAAQGGIVAVAPGRPRGAMLFGTQYGQQQTPVTGPDGVTPIVLDATYNVHLILGVGWAELWADTTLVWKALYNGEFGEANYLYIPNEWTLVNNEITGASASSGVIDAPDADTVYVVVNGQRRLRIDIPSMEITGLGLAAPWALTERAEQGGELERFGGTMFLVWDSEREDYRPYIEIDSDGLLTSALPFNQMLTTAEVEALWLP